MSSAKRRGQARGNAPDGAGRPSRGPNPARGRVTPFDGPASRGSGSGAGSQSQASGPPGASRRPSDAGSRAPSQPASQPASAQTPLIGRDPAREGPAARATDNIKNVDMPASFYNIDGMVSRPYTPSQSLSIHPLFYAQLLSSCILFISSCLPLVSRTSLAFMASSLRHGRLKNNLTLPATSSALYLFSRSALPFASSASTSRTLARMLTKTSTPSPQISSSDLATTRLANKLPWPSIHTWSMHYPTATFTNTTS